MTRIAASWMESLDYRFHLIDVSHNSAHLEKDGSDRDRPSPLARP